MRPSARLVTPLVRGLLASVCRIDSRDMRAIPRGGPLIVAMNHVNFLEVPLIYAYLYPRDAVGLVKAETWKNPVLAALAYSWGAIPLDRGATDLKAMRLALDALAAGRILIVAPEGTRSGHGRLQKGHGGIVQLALKSGAPIVPVAHTGGEQFWRNVRSWRRTRFSFRVGRPFFLQAPAGGESPGGRRLRDEMTDAVMNRIALLLPQDRRGEYPDPEGASTRTLRFADL